MNALVYFRSKGQRSYRKLGVQGVRELPATGSHVTVDIDGERMRARVRDRRETISAWRKSPRDLTLYLDAI